MLEVRDLHVHYGAIHALRGVSLTVNVGEIVTLLGANGAGKSTTLRTICGLLRASRGSIEFNDGRLDYLPAHEVARRGIGHVPEGRRVFPRLTVLENLQMGAYLRTAKVLAGGLEDVFRLFPRLKERTRQLAGTLSGGEQQMLAIARALMARPKLLLLDEPSMGLAPLMVEQIFKTIQTINNEGVTVLLVEQNAAMALSICERGYVLETGSIILEGAARDLMNNDRVRAAYLGG
jgi:branched-chain amino acid transport system ATP-binding protein